MRLFYDNLKYVEQIYESFILFLFFYTIYLFHTIFDEPLIMLSLLFWKRYFYIIFFKSIVNLAFSKILKMLFVCHISLYNFWMLIYEAFIHFENTFSLNISLKSGWNPKTSWQIFSLEMNKGITKLKAQIFIFSITTIFSIQLA